MLVKQELFHGTLCHILVNSRPDAAFEASLVDVKGRTLCVTPPASEHEVKFLIHTVAYDLHGKRQDMKAEAECELGWARIG
jgi:hypothetical protein